MLFKAFTTGLLLICAHALDLNLTCLTMDLTLVPAGLICHFKRSTFNAVENATVTAIIEAANDAYDIGIFAVTQYTVTVGYDYAKTAGTNGTSAANEPSVQQGKDIVNVDIRFGKEVVNTGATIMELTNWVDFSYCLMSGVTSLVGRQAIQTARTLRRRAPTVSTDSARGVLRQCASDKFKQIARPAVFNITKSNQKIRSTIATYAALLVPVGGEATAATNVAEGACDLVLPGDEDLGRFLGKTAEGKPAHLAADEWAPLKESLKEDDYFSRKCNSCSAPTPVSARRPRGEKARRAGGTLNWFCCGLPSSEVSTADFDTPDPDSASTSRVRPDQAPSAVAIHDIRSRWYSEFIPEDAVNSGSKVPAATIYADVVAQSKLINDDLQRTSTAILQWTEDVTASFGSSKNLFKFLRRLFKPTTDEDAELHELIGIRNQGNSPRLGFNSIDVDDINFGNAELKQLKAFIRASEKQVKETARNLRGLDDNARLYTSTDFYYIPEGEGLTNPDARGLHIDSNLLQFGAADQPGLIVQTGETLTRVILVDEAWHLLKCDQWDGVRSAAAATKHTVFGPEISQFGRVSVIVNVSRG